MALVDIDTIVVVMLENCSFDHMAGYLSLPSTPSPLGVEWLRDDPAWRADHAGLHSGHPYPVRRLDPATQDISDAKHNHEAIALEISQAPAEAPLGQMGGFVESYARFSNPGPADLRRGHGLLRCGQPSGRAVVLAV